MTPLTPFPQPLAECLGLAPADDVRAVVDVPLFDEALVAGYALRAADVAPATVGGAVTFPIVGELRAGGSTHLALAPGTAARVDVGARLPSGADAVVPLDAVDVSAEVTIDVTGPVAAGDRVRMCGSQVRAGGVVVERGARIGPREVGDLAAAGCAQIMASPRARVVIVSVGQQLREPGTPLAHDSAYDAASYAVAALVRDAGALAYRVGIVAGARFAAELDDQLVRADLVVTVGGVPDDVQVLDGVGVIGDDAVPLIALPSDLDPALALAAERILPAIRQLMGIER